MSRHKPPELTEQQRRQLMAVIEREIERVAYPFNPPTVAQLVIGAQPPYRPNLLARAVNAQALAEELAALRKQVSHNEALAYVAEKRSVQAELHLQQLVDGLATASIGDHPVRAKIDDARKWLLSLKTGKEGP